jgi:hypothetical protein
VFNTLLSLGFFCGDGNLYFSHKTHLTQLSLAGCYNQDWKFVSDLFERLNITHTIDRRILNIKKVNGTFTSSSTIRYTNIDGIMKFCQFIFSEPYDGIGLKRKYDKFIEVCQFKKGVRKILEKQKQDAKLFTT